MLKRKIYADLVEWKNRKHQCLVISGQRQVGKTFIVRQFAKTEYEHLLEINLATMKEAQKIFEGDCSVDQLIMRLNVAFPNVPITPGRTLIFLDEIQDCDEAFSSLKQFTEDGRFDVIASGSLLGVRSPRRRKWARNQTECPLVPMGYEENLRMFGLDFEEFLWAKGIGSNIIDSIRECVKRLFPLDPQILKALSSYYREYMIVGGMPESVSCFIEDRNFARSRIVLANLRTDCLRDINRYNVGVDIVKTQECFESIPDQLAESNKKFMYSRIEDSQSRQAADKYMENLLWIKGAGYGNFCYGLDAPTLPLKVRRSVFKVYLSDTGMLVNMYGDNCVKAIHSGDLGYNLGSITENAVAEALMKSGHEPRYFVEQKGEKRMELDFVLENGNGVVVIEVKSGKKRTAPSLNKVVRFYDIGTRIVLAEDNIRTDEEGIIHLPLFAACFLDELGPEWDGPKIR
ncbi:MAG: AAA family ATPase [archaeon]|nr:AAA family ATPase [archaeon]